MAIENIGSINNILKSGNTSKWIGPADLEFKKGIEFKELLDLKDAPKAPELNPGGPQTFGELLAGSITEVNELQKEANTAIQRLATGQSQNLHETMLQVEKAEIAFKTMNQIRIKVIDAYKEIMKMQV